MAKSNAVKRLERILADEDYGPKLARMNRADEARVLDLIDRNKGREARSEITRLDEARRARVRERRSSKTKAAPKFDIEQMRRDAFRNMYGKLHNKLKYDEGNNRKFSKLMDKTDAEFATHASRMELEDSARAMPYIDLDGTDVNPFWYH